MEKNYCFQDFELITVPTHHPVPHLTNPQVSHSPLLPVITPSVRLSDYRHLVTGIPAKTGSSLYFDRLQETSTSLERQPLSQAKNKDRVLSWVECGIDE